MQQQQQKRNISNTDKILVTRWRNLGWAAKCSKIPTFIFCLTPPVPTFVSNFLPHFCFFLQNLGFFGERWESSTTNVLLRQNFDCNLRQSFARLAFLLLLLSQFSKKFCLQCIFKFNFQPQYSHRPKKKLKLKILEWICFQAIRTWTGWFFLVGEKQLGLEFRGNLTLREYQVMSNKRLIGWWNSRGLS